MMYPCLEGIFSDLSQAIGNSSSPAASIMRFLETTAVVLACLSGQVLGRAVSHRGAALNVFEHTGVEQRALLQDIVSNDTPDVVYLNWDVLTELGYMG
jgi:hypothetical protein